jgi:hypothetical protein
MSSVTTPRPERTKPQALRLFLGSQRQPKKKQQGTRGYKIVRRNARSFAVDSIPDQTLLRPVPIQEDDCTDDERRPKRRPQKRVLIDEPSDLSGYRRRQWSPTFLTS